MFLITYWQPIAASVATFCICFLLHTVDVDRIEHKQAKALTDQATQLTLACIADKQITEGVSNEYEKKITNLNKQLAAKRMQSPHCIVPVTITPIRLDAKAGTDQHGGQNGVTDIALFDFSGEAERYRLQVIGLQDFLCKTWKAKTQPLAGDMCP